jgi:hypothetical protein
MQLGCALSFFCITENHFSPNNRPVYAVAQLHATCPKSYLHCILTCLHRPYVLSCLTPMHEHQLLPGGPHFSQPHLRCLWPAFGQGHQSPFYTIHEPCVLNLLGCAFVVSMNVLDMPEPSTGPINTSLLVCRCSGPLTPKKHNPHEPELNCVHKGALPVPKNDAAQ